MIDKDFLIEIDETQQLNAKGLTILMGAFAEKEDSDNQPLIASSIAGLKHAVRLIDDSPHDTEITLIFIPEQENKNNLCFQIDPNSRDFQSYPRVHKTSFSLRKNQDGSLQVIHMDSTSGHPEYFKIVDKLIADALKDNAEKQNRNPNHIHADFPEYPTFEVEEKHWMTGKPTGKMITKPLAMQTDGGSCGVYAVKYARGLCKDSLEKDALSDSENKSFFRVGLETLRRTQHPKTRDYIETSDVYDKDKPVNKKGLSYAQFSEKYSSESDYINKFSEKYTSMVDDFIKLSSPTRIEETLKRFNCENLTAERIAEINKLKIEQNKENRFHH